MKKTLAAVLAMVLALGMFSACGDSKTPAQSEGSAASTSSKEEASKGEAPKEETSSGDKQKLVLYNNKIEIVDALNTMAAAYNASHDNVELVVDTTGSDNYDTALKTRFTGGDAADIFVVTGKEQVLLWMEHLEDLSDQPWVSDMVDIAKPDITFDSNVYAFPVGIEGYGYMYNKDLFEQAGIEKLPLTLDEFKDTIAKLQAAGMEKPFVNTHGEWYQNGMFMFSSALAQQEDPYAFIDALNDGSATIVGNEAFISIANMVEVDFAACDSPLNTDFATQVSKFGSGTVAAAIGGTWSQPTLDDANPGMNIGLMPLPFMPNAEDNDVLYAGVTNYWAVNKNSPAKDAAKEFLNWLVSDPEGQRFLTTEIKNIPAFKSVPVDNEAIGPLGQSLSEYLAAGKTLGIYNSRYTFSAAQEFGTIFQKYVAGQINQEQFLQELQTAWDDNKTV